MMNTFPKNERLKSRKKLQEVFTDGKSVRAGHIRIVYLLEKSLQPEIKCGVGLTTRNFKHAVDRNRIKRLLREAYRMQQLMLKKKILTGEHSWHIFILYTGAGLPKYVEVYNNVGLALQKLLKANADDIENT